MKAAIHPPLLPPLSVSQLNNFCRSRTNPLFSSKTLQVPEHSLLPQLHSVVLRAMRNICCSKWFILCIALLFTPALAKNHGNPANELVNIINENRTAQRLQKLTDNPGLGCIALQYIEECKGACSSNNTVVNCKPPEDYFTEVFAPNCGVELPTFGTLSGHIVGCQSKYLKPPQAFSNVLFHDKKSLSVAKDKKHTEVGVGLVHTHQGPYFWCVLFSSDKINSTFVLEGGGRGIKQKRGCFSGTNIPCNRGEKIHNTVLNVIFSLLVYLYVTSVV